MGIALVIIGLLIVLAASVAGMIWTQRESEQQTIPLWKPTTLNKEIEAIKKEYPNAKITETDTQIIVDVEIVLEKPVEKITITGCVTRNN